MLLIAFLVGMYWAQRRAPRFGIERDRVLDLAFWMILAGIVGARIVYILLHLEEFSGDWSRLATFRFEGLTSFGGLLFGGLAVVVWARRTRTPLLAVMDTVALPVLVAHGIGRIGCSLNGCCYGSPAEVPWAIALPGDPTLRHPAQLYDTIMVWIGAGVLAALERRYTFRGFSTGGLLIAYGASRFLYEFWRDESTAKPLIGPITEAQVTSFFLILAGVIVIAWMGRRHGAAVPSAP